MGTDQHFVPRILPGAAVGNAEIPAHALIAPLEDDMLISCTTAIGRPGQAPADKYPILSCARLETAKSRYASLIEAPPRERSSTTACRLRLNLALHPRKVNGTRKHRDRGGAADRGECEKV